MTKLKIVREDIIVEFPDNGHLNYSDKRYTLKVDDALVVNDDDEALTFANPGDAMRYYMEAALDIRVGVYE